MNTKHFKGIVARFALATLILTSIPQAAAASSWNPTLLVNTESFQTIDEGDGTTDIEIRFGDTLNKKLYWDRARAQFRFTDSVSVVGTLSGSALRIDGLAEIHGALTASGAVRTDSNLTINDDADSNDAVLTFGSDTTNESLSWLNTADQFEFSDDVDVQGTLSGSFLHAEYMLTSSGAAVIQGTLSGSSTITFSSLKGCDTIDTDANGVLSCGSDNAGSTNGFGSGNVLTMTEDRYVNTHGDTMTGTLIIESSSGTTSVNLAVRGVMSGYSLNVGAGGATVSGSLVVGGVDGSSSKGDLIVRGGMSGSSLRVDQNADIWGALTVSGSATIRGTTNLNTVTYTWPAATAASSGSVLSVDPITGQLSWTSGVSGSGSIVYLKPQYPGAVYFASGSSAVGTLVARAQTGSTITNSYRWATTNTANQTYWISSQVRVPNNFRSWDPVAPIQFNYRSSGGSLNVKLFDTAGVDVPLTGASGLTNYGVNGGTTFSGATITGPEATGTYTVDNYITLIVKLTASGSGLADEYADAGFIELNWETKD